MFVDTHVHLHFPDFKMEVEQIIDRSQKAGVTHFVNVGTNVTTSREAIKVAEKYDFVKAAVGIHPHDVKDASEKDLEAIKTLAQHPEVVAIGEVGLDFYRNLSPEDVQRQWILQFFEVAKETGLPMVLHIRDAYDAMIELLKTHCNPPIRAVSHCFAADRKTMEALVSLGLFISFAGPISYKKNNALREAAQACPEDRILVETDAPYLAPQAYRGKRNEPAYMMETARWIAELRNITVEALGQITTKNADKLFQTQFSKANS